MIQDATSATALLSRRRFLRLGVRGAIVCGTGALTSLAWGSHGEPQWVQITRHELVLPNLPSAFDGLRVAHLTDFHIEFGNMEERLSKVCQLATAQGADIICLTGDYISHLDTWQEEPLYQGLRHLKASLGVFAVMGNHDYWADINQPRNALQRAGVRELRNEVVTLQRGTQQFHVCGVEDLLVGAGDIRPVRAALPIGGCAMMLAHEPDYLDEVAAEGRFDFMLAGHSHGGQVCLPLLGPLVLPPGGRKYPAGHYQVGGTQLYTNRGIGVVGLSIRFFCRPELALFTLKSG